MLSHSHQPHHVVFFCYVSYGLVLSRRLSRRLVPARGGKNLSMRVFIHTAACINNCNRICVQRSGTMISRNNLFTCVICVMWLLLDVLTCFVVGRSTTAETDAQYLTTQTWVFGFLAKAMLLWQLLRRKLCMAPVETTVCGLSKWAYLNVYWICFLLYGTLQAAVLFTFFALLAMNSTLLKEAMGEYTISVIISWNHLRHVTPVFFYLMLMQFAAPEIRQWPGSPRVHDREKGLDAYKFFLANLVICAALAMGLLHHALFEDDELYKYRHGHPDVGRNCALVFTIAVILTTYYSVYGFL